jgi:hypothetical protein
MIHTVVVSYNRRASRALVITDVTVVFLTLVFDVASVGATSFVLAHGYAGTAGST